MTSTKLQAALAGYIGETQVRDLIGGTRQNWAMRKESIRDAVGIEIFPDTWIYDEKQARALIDERAKYRPNSSK